jgi:dihydroneopterin aldolase
MPLLTIHLHKLAFFAYHGLYEEEQQNGNHFEVDVDIEADIPDNVQHLQDTIDYVKMYVIVEQRMQQSTKLLETLAQNLATLIHEADPRVTSVSVNIRKLSPPIKNFKGYVGISFKKEF